MNSPASDDAGGGGSEYEDNLEILRQIDFFSGFPLESLKIFAYLGTRRRFRAGEFLFEQDEEHASAFAVIGGRLRLERQNGDALQTIRFYGPGDFIGGLSLLCACRRLYSLRAEEESVCFVLDQEKFAKTLEQFPAQIPRLLQTVVQAITRWEEDFLAEMTDACGQCLPRLGVSLL